MQEDVHFLIDNAHPREVENVLRCLSSRRAYSVAELRERLLTDLNYKPQKNLSLSTRRLCDLKLAILDSARGGAPGYILTSLGLKSRNLLDADHDFYAEVMHYLHYDGYDGSPLSRKLFWSYKACCDIVWEQKQVPAAVSLASEVQLRIAVEFPDLYSRKTGGNFNVGGVSAWKAWVASLPSPPFDEKTRGISLRTRPNFELAILALDHVYRARGYRYGDPVVLDDKILDELARVFFLDHGCCRELLALASKMTRSVVLRDTFAGTSVNLMAPYGLENF